MTIDLISNGVEFLWLRCVKANRETEDLIQAGNVLFLDVFRIDENTFQIKPVQPTVILTKHPTQTSKVIESLRSDAGSADDDKNSTSTSCGISTSHLLNCAVISDGAFVTFLLPSEAEPASLYDRSPQSLFTTFTFCVRDGLIRQEGYVIFPQRIVTTGSRFESRHFHIFSITHLLNTMNLL